MWGSVLFVHEYRHELCTARIMSKDWLKITENIAPTTAAETGTRYDTCTCQKSGVAESSGGVPPPSAFLASTSIIPGGAREVSPPCHHATADSPPRQIWKHPPNTALRAPSHPTHRATPELLCVCVWEMHTLHAESVRTHRVFASAASRVLSWFQFRRVPCPIYVLLADTAAVASPGSQKYHAHGTPFVVCRFQS